MAFAKKCDICGRYYTNYNVKKSAENVNGFMLLNIDDAGKYYSHETVDCCPKCMASIKHHLATLTKNNEE